MFGLDDTGSGVNMVNLDYHQSVSERYPNLELKFDYLKYLGDALFLIYRVREYQYLKHLYAG